MRILSAAKVVGMVPYTDCSEIPAFVVMELVNGPNLYDAVQCGYLDSWHDVLRFAVDLTEVIRRAHQLPQRVLHRDIRPPNIMLRDYETDPTDASVVVLDFDLSWYKDATEPSILDASSSHGYLAPEQLERTPGVSTKNAAVDSFGLGMTLYFMRTKRHPVYMEHRHADWENTVSSSICSHKCREWHSLPARFASLVLHATRDRQSERYDVAQILGELQRLRDAVASPGGVRAADLLCHELAYRCCERLGQEKYLSWNADFQRARLSMTGGVTVSLEPDKAWRRVAIQFDWANTGMSARRNIRRYAATHVTKASSVLRAAGVEAEPVSTDPNAIGFRADIGTDELAPILTKVSEALADAVREFRFE